MSNSSTQEQTVEDLKNRMTAEAQRLANIAALMRQRVSQDESESESECESTCSSMSYEDESCSDSGCYSDGDQD